MSAERVVSDLPLLRIRDLRVAFAASEVVHGVDLEVRAGEVLALVGESGSGKSVTAQSVLRLLDHAGVRYPSGSIMVNGQEVLSMSPAELCQLRGRQVGMVFQEPQTALNPVLTIAAQIEEALELHTGLGAEARRARALELLHQVGLTEAQRRLDQYPHELSGGMRQRVCLAIALACNPPLLIADEPTTALDVTVQAQILHLLRQLQQSRGLGVLFITHDLALVAGLADRVAVMRHGRVLESGPTVQVFAQPQHAYTQALLGCRPSLAHAVSVAGQRRRLPTVPDDPS
jgi:microcin C transport system ATP-binding protein